MNDARDEHDAQAQWWEEDAARVNEMVARAQKAGLTIRTSQAPPPLHPDGSLQQGSSTQPERKRG